MTTLLDGIEHKYPDAGREGSWSLKKLNRQNETSEVLETSEV
jgi:hypothetical protein